MDTADVAIIGGGPAGTAAALAHASAGSTVVVLERSHYERIRVGEILPPAVQLPLRELGVWDRFREQCGAPSPGFIAAWGHREPHVNDFLFDPLGDGWYIDRAGFDRMLVGTAEDAGIRVRRGARLGVCHDRRNHWILDADVDGEAYRLRASTLVDATGRGSWLARRLGGGRIVHDRLMGVVGILDPPAGDAVRDRRALLESCPDGWWYSAPLPDRRVLAAFVTGVEQVNGATTRPARLWWERLRSAPLTEMRIGPVRPDVHIRVFATSISIRRQLAGSNWIAVGDAATALDPLCGQGVGQALESGLAAARATTAVNGNAEAARAEYVSDVERRFLDHLRLRVEYYGMETRWPDSTFWTRRSFDHGQPIGSGHWNASKGGK